MMAITAEEVATLRAYLKSDFAEHDRLHAQLDPVAAQTGYSALISAAFVEAVERRFAPSGSASEVIEFVAEVRSRSEGLSEDIDQRVAECLILAVYTEEEIDDIDGKKRLATQFLLLTALILDEQLDDAGLDDFLDKARALAEQWIAG